VKSTWYYFGGLAGWILSLFLYLQPRIWMVEWGYRLAELHKLVLHQEKENQNLRMDWVQLRSAQRIKQIAQKELGMIFPRQEQVIRIGMEDQ
tara:strand:- start:393 stop:668 length:276 start_codon:yes stop_codon:yes gene_type:complete